MGYVVIGFFSCPPPIRLQPGLTEIPSLIIRSVSSCSTLLFSVKWSFYVVGMCIYVVCPWGFIHFVLNRFNFPLYQVVATLKVMGWKLLPIFLFCSSLFFMLWTCPDILSISIICRYLVRLVLCIIYVYIVRGQILGKIRCFVQSYLHSANLNMFNIRGHCHLISIFIVPLNPLNVYTPLFCCMKDYLFLSFFYSMFSISLDFLLDWRVGIFWSFSLCRVSFVVLPLSFLMLSLFTLSLPPFTVFYLFWLFGNPSCSFFQWFYFLF